jgi:hypothetical protein
MIDLLDQIEASLSSRQYYLSLFATLTVPDIAGALGSSDGIASGKRYAEWFDTWVHPAYIDTVRSNLPEQAKQYADSMICPLSGEDCYRFRCSLLHQGTTQHPRSAFSRILFVEPGATTTTMHYNVVKDALNIDLPLFCMETLAAARNWLTTVNGTEPFETNLIKFVQRYPAGLKPYISGAAVIG